MEEIFSNITVLKQNEVFDMAKRYFSDAKYFASQKKWVEAFEAAVISWAYIDALLHLGYVKVPEKLKKFFT